MNHSLGWAAMAAVRQGRTRMGLGWLRLGMIGYCLSSAPLALGSESPASEVVATEADNTSPLGATRLAAKAPSNWETAAHLGFAIADQSSTGFRHVGGSLVCLDTARAVYRNLSVGLRTVAAGGHGEAGRQFYRLGAGPLLVWHLPDGWVVSGNISRFDESGLTGDAQRQYSSAGTEVGLGWERSWRITPRVETAWGGFVMAHQGGITAMNTSGNWLAATVDTNQGLSHGLEVALRIWL